MSVSWPVLDLAHLVNKDKEAGRWAYLRKLQKNPDDYVSIRIGFTHVAYAHSRHQGPAVALISEQKGVEQEEINCYSLKKVNAHTGVSIKYENRDLICCCCEDVAK